MVNLPPIMRRLYLLSAVLALGCFQARSASDHRGIQFVSLTNLASFEKSLDSSGCTDVLVSYPIASSIKWDELVVSWNAQMTSNSWLKVEARPFHGDMPAKFYNMGEWSSDRALTP